MTAIPDLPGFSATGGAFYLHGDEQYLKEQAVQALVNAHLDPATKDFNLDPLRGTEVDGETLASVIATPPMMAEYRVVVLREVEGLAGSKKAREHLLSVVASPPPGLALVMSCTVPKGSKAKFYKDLARLAQSRAFQELSDADVPGWLMARAQEAHGIEIEVDAARALGAAIGVSLGVLAKELEKLADFVGDRKVITRADVDAAGTKLPSQDRWRWFDMVSERRFEEARAALPVLLGMGETGVGLVIGLSAQLLRLGVARGAGARRLEELLPRNQQWLARNAVKHAKHWTADEIDRALAGLLDVDRLLKASPHTDEHFLEAWLLGLMARAEAA